MVAAHVRPPTPAFDRKLVRPEVAVRAVSSGQRIFVGSGCAKPQALVRALCSESGRLHDVELVHLLTMGIADYVDVGFDEKFRHNAFFIGSNVRDAVSEGRADYTPIFLSESPALLRSGQRRPHVAMVQLSPPDRHGYCSMGVHVDIQQAAMDAADLVIAEINPNMPRTMGSTGIHVDRIDYFVETTSPILELPPPKIDEVSERIGVIVSNLVENGSCLQMGIGGIPNAVLAQLGDKRDLGIHSEMFSDGVLPLIEGGNVTNAHKQIHPGKTVTSFVMGTRPLYDFVDDNPSVAFYPSDFVNDPRVIASNDRVVAVNSALQVDLTGQVCADSLGYRFYSGIGGQVDFIRGAAMSPGGKPIIALPSTARHGTISRIVPTLDEGAGVVTSRGDVHYVVTEYGVAYLHGKTIRERALALINVAHPDFRLDLLDFVRRKHYVVGDQGAWNEATTPYPADVEHTRDFGDATLTIRPLRPTDERVLQEFFYRHRPETVYNRYFTTKKSLPLREAAELCSLDYERRMALGAFRCDGGREELVAVGRYNLNPRRNRAETAFVVDESLRNRGIAKHLLEKLRVFAERKQIDGFYAEVLPTNGAMLGVHKALGHVIRWSPDSETYLVEYEFTESANDCSSRRAPASVSEATADAEAE